MRPKPGDIKSSLTFLSGAHENLVTTKGVAYRLEVIPRKRSDYPVVKAGEGGVAVKVILGAVVGG